MLLSFAIDKAEKLECPKKEPEIEGDRVVLNTPPSPIMLSGLKEVQ